MRVLIRIVVVLVCVLVAALLAAWLDGRRLPVDHTATVSGVVNASPQRVFGLITDVANGPKWRPAVKSVTVMPPDNGRDHWIEDLGHGAKMDFLALSTEPVSPAGTATRVVRLTDPRYGGDWTYDLAPGPTADQTQLTITETGYIHPPIFRSVAAHVLGYNRNLNQYMNDLRNAVK